MIEIKNLTKIYKPKKGLPVNAVNDVSLKFGDTGLIFLLGKSGSGKSTLLNLIGGLDTFDSGDILIKNKSTKTFSQSDFDNYRNTFVGFIFQEYNLLEDFNVEKNILLSLELQGKKKNEDKLKETLKKVDLENYEKRNINELSGGQRQRVAIARSLIKDPKILLADEPTGALDKKTGIQILSTLKELSKDRLVIVVSHDNEFAFNFADRVIELEDGKIINDTILNNNANTDKENKKDNNLTFIKSKLGTKKALRMGASSLKHKKIKLFFTILMLIFSFSMLGFYFSTVILNSYQTALKSVYNQKAKTILLSIKSDIGNIKQKKIPFSAFFIDLNNNDYSLVKDKIKNYKYKKIFYTDIRYDDNLTIDEKNDSIYNFMFFLRNDSVSVITKNNLSDINAKLEKGRLPNNKYEIAITNFMYKSLKKSKVSGFENIVTQDDIINKTFTLNNKKYTIVGIVNTNIDFSKFDDFKLNKDSRSNLTSYIKFEILEDTLNNSFATSLIVDDSFMDLNKFNFNLLIEKPKNISELKSLSKSIEKIKLQDNKNLKNRAFTFIIPTSLETIFLASSLLSTNKAVKTVLAIFIFISFSLSALLFMSYISNSISFKRKDIGILRSLGSRGIDLFKIFISEGLIISTISSIIAFICFAISLRIANNSISGNTFDFDFLPITFWHFMIFICIGIFATIVSCLIPIIKLTRKKPIDVISNK